MASMPSKYLSAARRLSGFRVKRSTGGGPTTPGPAGYTYTLVDYSTGNLSQWTGGIGSPEMYTVLTSAESGTITPAKGTHFCRIATTITGGFGNEAGCRGAPPPDNAWGNDRWSVPLKLAGVTDYFGCSFYFPPSWLGASTAQANASLAQLGFNGLANTVIQWHVQSPASQPPKTPGSIEIQMLTGKVSWPGEGTFPNPGTATFTPGTQTYQYNTENQGLGPYFTGHKLVPESRWGLGVWHHVICAVTWATGATGRVQGWHKRKGVDSAWTKTLDVPNVPTIAWGWGATGTNTQGNYMDSFGRDRYGNDWLAINKFGPYWQAAPSGLPRTYYHDTFSISTSLSAAQGALE